MPTVDLFDLLVPDDTADAPNWEPSSITQTNDLVKELVLRFRDLGTKNGAGFKFKVPADYVGGGTFKPLWTSTATAGNVVWDADYYSAAPTATRDPAAFTEALTVTDAAPGTSQLGKEPSMAATAANFTAGHVVTGVLSRDGASGSDTMAADAVLYGFTFDYTT